MKILVFGNREDEAGFFYDNAAKYGYEVSYTPEILSAENVLMARGFDAVCIVVSCIITREVAARLKECGVKYILTRAAGTDHLDVEAIHELGMHTANVPVYSPNAIAEHTVMLILAALRKLKEQMLRVERQDFTLKGLRARELRNMTVGIIGTGRIGCMTIKNLSGFGCRMLAADLYENEAAKPYVQYVPVEQILQESDILVFHCPLTAENYHMINAEVIGRLRRGVILINTARGGLFDFEAVLEGLQSGVIGALGMDVYEMENQFLRKDMAGRSLKDPVFERLLEMDNVIYTTHTAFYTDEAISNMIGISFENLHEYLTTGSCRNEVRR